MKNSIFKILIFSLLAFFSACTDLQEQPVGILAPEGFFKTPKDVEVAVFGAYGRLASESVYGRKLTLTLQVRSDMVDIGDRGTPARRQQVNDFNMDAFNGMVTAIWPAMYQAIGAANSAIEGARSISADESVKNTLEAEARFIRAFSYYHLVRLFHDIPYIDFFINDPTAIKTLAKTPAAEIYEGIVADLQFGKEHLPDQYTGDLRSRPTVGTAAAYLASVYLTLGQYQQAAQEAKFVIDNSNRFGYQLESDFQDLYIASQADQIKETIFALDFLGQQTGSGGANQDFMPPVTGIRGSDNQGWSVNVPSMAVFESWDARDYRRKVSMEDSTLINGELRPYTDYQVVKRPHIAKLARFPGNSGADGRTSDHNYVCFRYAEVLLIAAEALNEMNGGPNAETVGYLNQIRARARNWPGNMTNFPEDVTMGMGQQAFLDTVMEERRIELAFEYKRWYDIKRRDMGDEVFKGANALEPHPNFDASRDYLFPLPQDELDRNVNLMPQNSGY